MSRSLEMSFGYKNGSIYATLMTFFSKELLIFKMWVWVSAILLMLFSKEILIFKMCVWMGAILLTLFIKGVMD